jgi:hypothetical protein
MSTEKCLKDARKALAVHMTITTEGCKNVKCSFVFFDKAKGNKIVAPPPIRCWGDGNAILNICNTRITDRQRLCSGNLRLKKVGCHIELLLLT